MLIRLRGGESGIKEYLETGRKDGRDYSRRELDERVVLAGNLEQIDQVLGCMNKTGEQYLHVTLSFKEDDVDEESLRVIAQEFREFALSAYRDDEVVFYAEAHLPRIKGYADQRTGERVERKPHIHIVIPEWNLLTNRQVQPFGLVRQNLGFIDAFQEHVNAKYGFASPKEHRRVRFTDESTMIARYKGDLFDGAGREVKEKVLGLILDRNVRSTEALTALLEKEIGPTHEVKSKRTGPYLNVKSADAARGTNLKGYVFSAEFLALPVAEKRAKLQEEIVQRYETAGVTRQTPDVIVAKLTEWHDKRSAEIKYLHSGHKDYKAYWGLAEDKQTQVLAALRERFYQRHDRDYDDGRTGAERESDERGTLAAAQGDLRAAAGNIDAVKRDPRRLDEAERFQADRRTRRAVGAAVARLVGDQAAVAGDERVVVPNDSKEGRALDSEIAQLHASTRRQPMQGREIDRIKATLDADHLLQYVARSHGVSVEKYGVTKARDGSDRIVCGKRQLNVSDFLTHEMRMPWKEAADLLRQIDATEREPERQAAQRRQSVWARFAAEWRPLRQELRKNDFEKQKKSERQRFDQARMRYQNKRRAVQNDRSITSAQRRAALSLMRMEKVGADLELRRQIGEERKALKLAYQIKPADEFREFLADRATRGDEAALQELRRQRLPESSEPNVGVRAGDKSAVAADAVISPHVFAPSSIRYEVNSRGHVAYQDETRATLFTDTGRAVDFSKRDRQTRELGLRLAVEKFGPKLALYGSDAYKLEMAQIAASAGLRVTFVEPAVQAHYEKALTPSRAGRSPAPAADHMVPGNEAKQDFVQIYVDERMDYKRRAPASVDDFKPWEPTELGEFKYDGWRTLKDGTKALLLRRDKTVHVMQASNEVVKEIERFPRGRALHVGETGHIAPIVSQQDQGMER